VVTVGGKTGSGDNRFETFNRAGGIITSRATNRTATFVFYIGERYFGVITAYVQGREADNYHFTSSLPVTLLKLLAPTVLAKLDKNFKEPPVVAPEKEHPGEKAGPMGSSTSQLPGPSSRMEPPAGAATAPPVQ